MEYKFKREDIDGLTCGYLNSLSFEEKLKVLREFEMQETRIYSIIYLRAHIFSLLSPEIMANVILTYQNPEDISCMVNQPLREYLYPHLIKEDRATIYFTHNKTPNKYSNAYE